MLNVRLAFYHSQIWFIFCQWKVIKEEKIVI